MLFCWIHYSDLSAGYSENTVIYHFRNVIRAITVRLNLWMLVLWYFGCMPTFRGNILPPVSGMMMCYANS